MGLSTSPADLRRRRLRSQGHVVRTSPSVGRVVGARMVDLAFGIVAVDAACRAGGSGSMLAQIRESVALDAAPEAVARYRPEDLLAASLWLSVVAWADANAGRTPGRAVAGLRLERRDGQRLTLARMVIRESTADVRHAVVKALWPRLTRRDRQVAALALAGLNVAGLAVRAVDDERRTMGDWVAGTRLVRG